MPGAGAKRCKLTIQRIATTPTAGGETADTNSTYCTVFAEIIPLGGRELMLARAQQDLSTHRIRCVYTAGVTAKMRGVYAGRTFNFTSVVNVGELNRELEIMAVEDVSQ